MTTVVVTRSVGTPWLAATAIVLSFAAGATDAFAFLRLGGIFTANMTGNLVLIGLTERPGYLNTLFGAIIAVLVFAATVYVAHRIARPGATLRRGLLIVLGATLLAQVAVLIGWIVSPQPLELAIQGLLIAFSAIAMAGQTSVSKRVEKHSGVTTTFVTGTITSLMGDFADRHAPGPRHPDRRDLRPHRRSAQRLAADGSGPGVRRRAARWCRRSSDSC